MIKQNNGMVDYHNLIVLNPPDSFLLNSLDPYPIRNVAVIRVEKPNPRYLDQPLDVLLDFLFECLLF